jgi:hypothetical protein
MEVIQLAKYDKVLDKYRCSFCGKIYKNPLQAGACESSHGLIYIAIKKTDLMSLIQFIYNPDIKLLNPKFVEQLTAYARVKETTYDGEDLPSMQE